MSVRSIDAAFSFQTPLRLRLQALFCLVSAICCLAAGVVKSKAFRSACLYVKDIDMSAPVTQIAASLTRVYIMGFNWCWRSWRLDSQARRLSPTSALSLALANRR
eukprot:gnl/TRDRNA2_/TRDRNA2_84176_c0_seq1.p2 gnl/TRDRNA2_/TRDRNA2_84176_c0~~gnl/TRDRNA2_/TRDRNA2_84176_c0_seq1.p2  ORF type:complete len:105 (-),score=7.74 gnl/TRDRNA2_/TRDRNA2_84176_c0_seq1:19-333(-)